MKTGKPYIDGEGEVRELDEHFFRNAIRGRPPFLPEARKVKTTIMLDPAVIARFKEGGKGWQTRVNAALRKVAGLEHF